MRVFLQISLFRSEKDNEPKPKTLPWEEFAAELLKVEKVDCAPCKGKDCPKKYGEAWSPAHFEDGKIRKSQFVDEISCAVFDLDDVTDAQIEEMGKALEGLEFVIHPTHNNKTLGHRYRLVLPLLNPFKKEDLTNAAYQKAWEDWRTSCVKKFKIPADPACKDLARLYFFGTSPHEARGVHEIGSLLVVDEACRDVAVDVLRGLKTTNAQIVQGDPQAVSADQPVDLDAVRKKISAVLPSPLSQNILEGKALAQDGARNNTVNQVMSRLAWHGLPEEGVIEVLRASIAAMLPKEGVDYWINTARYSFRRAVGRLKDLKSEEYLEDKDFRDALEEFVKTNTPENPKSPPPPKNWRTALVTGTDKNGIEFVKPTPGNLSTFLRHDPIWRGAFRMNMLTHSIEIFSGPISCNTSFDALPSEVADWFMNVPPPTERISLPDHVVKSRILSAALEWKFDPLKEHIMSIKRDPSRNIIDTWAEDYLGVKTVDDNGEDITQYVRKASKKWLVQAVARALDPGCQADACLVLEGEQRIGKTSAIRILGGQFHKEASLNLQSKDSQQAIISMHIVELAELAALVSGETEHQKDFLTRKNDYFRLPYAAKMEQFPRRCVFAGTTNSEEYFKDFTGNSRYWVLKCGEINLPALKRDRDQLFAEARDIYFGSDACADCVKYEVRCDIHNWWLNKEDRKLAERQADQRMEDDGILPLLQDWWTKTSPKERAKPVTTMAAAIGAMSMQPGQVNRSVRVKIGRALNKMGFTKRRRSEGFVYQPTDDLMAVPYNVMGAVANAKVWQGKTEELKQ